MKRLIIIDGPLNSGKTALAESLVIAHSMGNEGNASITHWEPSFFFGESPFDMAKMSEAITQCKVTIKGAMKRGDELVIISHKFPNFWQKKYYLDLALKFDYEVQEIYLKKTVQTVDKLIDAVNSQLEKVAA